MLTAVVAVAVVAAIVAALIWGFLRTRATDRRYRLLLEHLPQTSVVLYDRDLRIRLVVGSALRESGLEPSQVQGKRLQDVVPREQGEVLARYYEAGLRGESPSLEYSSDADGGDYWLRIVPIRQGGRITGGMAVSQDITDRKQAERAHQRAEGARRGTIEAMNEAYVAVGPDGLIKDWNARAAQLFGYTREEAIGRPARDLLPPEKQPGFDRVVVGRLRPDGEPLETRAERTVVHKDGRRFPIEFAAATLRRGDSVQLHAFMHDISDRKLAEAEIAQHAREVEAIAEATGTLARSTDPEQAREAICRAATTVAEADFALLFEPDPSGSGLAATAAVGAEIGEEPLPFVGPPSGAVRSFVSNEPVFIDDVEAADDRGVIRRIGARSGYWTPVRRGAAPLGVIVVGWRRPLAEFSPRLGRVMGLVAAEAAVAIDRAALLERLARMARTDDLTGLPNRRAWDAEMVREMARSRREGTPLTVAMVDLDFFKAYNDAHGHQAGDRLLKEAAGAWRSVLRETDVIARYGGEEFAIALPGCPPAEAEKLVERLRAVTPAGESCSAGIATWDGAEQSEAVLGRADQALYEAKQTGRNRTVVA